MRSYLLPLDKIVISTWINKQLKEKLGIGPFPIVYDGLDTLKFSNPHKTYKRNGEEIRCLMLNHNLSKKGVSNGIKAFELAKVKFPDMVLESFGQCGRGNLPGYVQYTQNPTPTELVEIYCRSDIFIFPSVSEGWGLTPLEAMACRCAVVGTRTGFVLDLGKHGFNMMISEPEDVEGLAENIVRVAQNEELLQSISEQGWKLTQKLSWYESCDKLEHILKKMAK